MRIWRFYFIAIFEHDIQYMFDYKYILNISLARILVHSYCIAINTKNEILL